MVLTCIHYTHTHNSFERTFVTCCGGQDRAYLPLANLGMAAIANFLEIIFVT